MKDKYQEQEKDKSRSNECVIAARTRAQFTTLSEAPGSLPIWILCVGHVANLANLTDAQWNSTHRSPQRSFFRNKTQNLPFLKKRITIWKCRHFTNLKAIKKPTKPPNLCLFIFFCNSFCSMLEPYVKHLFTIAYNAWVSYHVSPLFEVLTIYFQKPG